MKRLLLISLIVAAVLGCTASHNPYEIWRTSSQPSSLVVTRDGAWFAYGENVNGESGVGLIHDRSVRSLTRRDSVLEVTALAKDRRGEVYFAAKHDPNIDSPSALIGRVTTTQLENVGALAGVWINGLATNHQGDLYFIEDQSARFGFFHENKMRVCTLSGHAGLSGSRSDKNLLESDGDAVWMNFAPQEQLVIVRNGCDSKVVLRNVAPPIGISVSQGDAWLLYSNPSRVVRVAASGSVSEQRIGFGGTPTTIETLGDRVCVATRDPSALVCRGAKTWEARLFPVSGVVSSVAMGPDGAIWATYLRLYEPGGNSVGAVVRFPPSFLPDGSQPAAERS